MKSSLPIVVLILLTNPIKAQLDKSVWLVGGNGTFYSYTENYSTSTFSQVGKFTIFDLGASIGYFFIDKFVVGLRPSFSSYKGEVLNTPGGTNQLSFSIGPFVRYYLLSKDKPYNILFDASYQPGINKYLRSPQEKGKSNTLSIMGGSEIFFNSSVGLEILLGYSSKMLSIDDSQSAFKTSRKGFQTSIGLTFHLEKL